MKVNKTMVSNTRKRLLLAEADSLKAYCLEQQLCHECIFYNEDYDPSSCALRFSIPAEWPLDVIKEVPNERR